MSKEYEMQAKPRHNEKIIKSDNDNNERLKRMFTIRTSKDWDDFIAYCNKRRRLWICINNEKECITEDGPYKMSLRRAQEKAIYMASIDDKMYGGKHEYQIWLNHDWREFHYGFHCVECIIASDDPILPKPNTQPPTSMLTSL